MKDLLTQETIDFIAGSTAGALSIIVGQPFDTIKVKLQINSNYNGPIDCFKQLIKNEGIIGLFSGIGPPLLTSTVVNAIIFTSYGFTLKMIKKDEETKATISQMFIAGSAAGFSQSFLTGPGELIKIRLQTDKLNTSSYDVIKKIIKTSGIKGLFRGYITTCYRELPAFGSYFTSYYTMIDLMGDQFGEVLPSFVAGGFAGAISWAIVYPIDIAKTMIQMSETSSTSTFQTLKYYYQSHGWRSLYRGLGTTIVRSLPVNAVVFPVYETVSSLLSEYSNEI